MYKDKLDKDREVSVNIKIKVARVGDIEKDSLRTKQRRGFEKAK